MSSLLEHYKVLEVSYGAGIADVTSSYKRLCRIHHPDVSNDPESDEMMKKINIAYTTLREKYKREAAFRERQASARPVWRYASTDTRAQSSETRAQSSETRTQNAETRKSAAEIEKEAYTILNEYFKAINSYDYSSAYNYLSSYDKQNITRDSFIEWRKSVARLYPLREFKITGGLPVATMNWGEERILYARRFRVEVTEDNYSDEESQADDVEKLVIYENGLWRVFLGYMSVSDLTRKFDERYESKWKRDVAKRWEDYNAGIYPEYNMLSLSGMRKAAAREMYRQRRFGCAMTFAAISVKASGTRGAGYEQLLRSAAKTIRGSLRETDFSAYAGDGVFALLLIELRRRNAGEIIRRMTERIRKNAGPQLGAKASIEYEYESWNSNALTDIDSLNNVLKKFRKKM